MNDETTLLSCPFCGSEAGSPIVKKWTNCLGDKSYSASMRCNNCNLLVKTESCGYETREAAISAIISIWNTRAYLNPDGLPNGLTISNDNTLLNWRGENYVKQSTIGRVCKNISDPPEGFLCSNCGWGDFAEPSHLLTSAKYTGRIHGGPNYCPNCGAML